MSGLWVDSVFIVTFLGKDFLYCFIDYILTLLLVKFFLAFPFFLSKIPFMGERKIFSTRIDEDAIKELKHLSVDEGQSLGSLLEEAIKDLLKKYGKKPPKK